MNITMNPSSDVTEQLFENNKSIQVVQDSVRIQSETETEIHSSVTAVCLALTVINILIGTPANVLICTAVALNR